MPYDVELTQKAKRQLTKLDRPLRARLFGAIEQLSNDPRPAECKKLKGSHNEYRVRAGDYRVLYLVTDSPEQRVTVVWIGHRRDAY